MPASQWMRRSPRSGLNKRYGSMDLLLEMLLELLLELLLVLLLLLPLYVLDT